MILSDVFGFTMSPWQIVLRGSVVYWFLFAVFRLVLRRDVGSMGVSDFLFVVLLGDAAQNGMIGDATSTSDAIVLLSTLVFWNVVIDWATFRWPALDRVLASTKLKLVVDGLSQRVLGVVPRPAGKNLAVRLGELVLLYFVVGGIGVALEQRAGQVAPQGWEFYAVTGALFLTFAFPGFVWRYLYRHGRH